MKQDQHVIDTDPGEGVHWKWRCVEMTDNGGR